MRQEAEIAGRPYEKLPDLETLLYEKTTAPPSLLSNADSVRQTTETDPTIAEHVEEGAINGGEIAGLSGKPEEVQLAPTPDDNAADTLHVHDDAADEAAIAAQFGQDAMHASNDEASGDTMDLDTSDGNDRTEASDTSEVREELAQPSRQWWHSMVLGEI